MGFIDSHAHYWDSRFTDAYGSEGVDPMVDALVCGAGAEAVINIGTSPETSRLALRQAYRHPFMVAAVGIHPTDAAYIPDIPAALTAVEQMLDDPRAVAVGEIGLDYHEPDAMRALQRWVLDVQLATAEKHGLPVIIHDRDAHGDCFDAVCRHPHVTGVFHSYSGSTEMALDLIRRGWYISFSGTVTFKNAARVASVAAAVPHDRVLVETDCPYLTPHPHRGELNHSGMIPFILDKLAQLWDMTPDECGRITAANTRRLFRKLPCQSQEQGNGSTVR